MKYTEFKQELENQIKSNRSLIYVTTHEEHRIDECVQEIACSQTNPWNYVFWDVASETKSNNIKFKHTYDQMEILTWFYDLKVDKDEVCVLVLHDFYKFLAPEGNGGQVELITIRSLRNLIEKCHLERKYVIITGAKYYMPIEFAKIVFLLDMPLPDTSIIEDKLNSIIELSGNNLKIKEKFKLEYNREEVEMIIKAFHGLSLREIEMISTYLILTEKEFDVKKIASKKRDVIKQTGILEWIDVEFEIDQVGGLNNLKNWLFKRRNAFTDKAVEFGLPPNPKGLLITGVQGAGKSRISKAIASYWSLPLLRLDMGRVFSGIVGSSEENLRLVIKTAEAVAPCVLWCDEIDKAFSTNMVSTDSGTSSRVFGSFLTWLQDKKSTVFVVATANVVHHLPPELIRKGRFDDIFFVDLPNPAERSEIWKIHLSQRKYKPECFDLEKLINESSGYTGAEIEASIISALYECFSEEKDTLTTVDIIKELQNSIPLSVTMKESIDELRQWAAKRARMASVDQITVHKHKDKEIEETLIVSAIEEDEEL